MSLRRRINRTLHGLTGGGFTRLRKLLRGKVLWAGAQTPSRAPVTHVILLDGTMSTLEPGRETNAGLVYRLADEMRRRSGSPRLSVYYEAGIQWRDWRSAWPVATGKGIDAQICRAYGVLASRYRPGDRVFLFGYSRGAFAVRSLAGMIDRVGLLRADQATVRNVETAFRHYQADSLSAAGHSFAQTHCHGYVEIEMIGVWDTVKALGLPWPIIWRLFERHHRFHNASLGLNVRHGYHALARDETRRAYQPILWRTFGEFPGRIEQLWFPGTHGDVGGQLDGFEAARPLSWVSLNWMLARAEETGLPLPEDWGKRFPADPDAPSMGHRHGWGRLFFLRSVRQRGNDPSEADWQPDPAAHKNAQTEREGAR